ncbi:MAG: TolC family protein [Myxococcales bacterium]|jgi:outer membrane protein TolC
MDKQPLPRGPGWLGLSLTITLAACATTREQAVGQDVRALPPPPAPRGDAELGEPLRGDLRSLVAAAMRRSPELRAAFHELRAESLSISGARRLPDPKLTYGYFIRSVETRVGPQRHRFGLSQTIPWPGKLSAGADAASARSKAALRKLEAVRLGLRLRVTRAYYALWLTDQEERIEREQKVLLEGLSATARAHLQAGQGNLASVTQIDLAAARTADRLVALQERARGQRADLRAAIGAAPDATLELRLEAPEHHLPATDEAALRSMAARHPGIARVDTLAEARDAATRSAEAERLPSFTLGVDYIETGDAAQPGVADSGKDPVVAMVSVSLPVWAGSYDDSIGAERAQAAALRARADGLRDVAAARVSTLLARLRDTHRRVELHSGTLMPQARAAFESVTSAFSVGDAGVASVLLAQRDLLEVRLELARARHDHAVAWAELEDAVGTPVPDGSEEEVAP